MRMRMVAGNWKMNLTLVEGRSLMQALRDGLEKPSPASSRSEVEVLICPPMYLLFPMAKAIAGSRIMLGAQNCHEAPQGAFTGEVSVGMLKDAGCTHVIIGHSERRHYFGERGPSLAKKVRAGTGGCLTVIYCVGETLADREAGRTEEVIGRQVTEAISSDLPPGRLVLAYEPVWAIGTGRNASPDQAQQVHAYLRESVSRIYDPSTADQIRILYGGSVKPENAQNLAEQPDIDGMLVGGASLVAADFLAIISAVDAAAGIAARRR